MKRHLLACACAAALTVSLCAQIQVQIDEAPNTNNGIVLVKADNSKIIKTLPAATTSSYRYVTHYEQNPYAYLNTYLTSPYSYGTRTYNRFGVQTRAYARKGSTHKSMYMTGDKNGTSTVQKYVVTISSPTATNVQLDLSVYGYIYDNATASLKLTDGNTINESYNYNQAGYNRVSKSLQLAIPAGTPVTLQLEATGQVTPGAGTNQYYDGYYTSLYCYVIETGGGSATLFGKTCGTPTMQNGGTPTAGAYYNFDLKGAPANGAVTFLYGYTKDTLGGFLALPMPLDYMGAIGCELNVGYSYPWARVADANGDAQVRMYLSRYYNGKIYGQWVVFDTQANAAGLTLTQALEVKY